MTQVRHLRLVGMEQVWPSDLIAEWELWMRSQGLSPRTIGERTRIVHQAAREMGVEAASFTPRTIQAWLAGHAHATTRVTYYSAVAAWSQWLVRLEHRVDDPTMKVPRPKAPKGRPRPVATAHLNAVLELDLATETRTKFLLAAYAGLRASEIAAIQGRWVDLVAGTLRVIGKGGSDEIVPLHPVLAREAQIYPRRGYWFPSPERPGEHVRAASVTNVISDAFSRVGVDATAHQIRHWFATTLISEGVDVRVVQELMRHKSLNTTAIYTEVADAARREAIDFLPSLAHTWESDQHAWG